MALYSHKTDKAQMILWGTARRLLRRYCSFMIDWSSCSAVERDPEKVSGSWVFRNTRVPVIALFENLEGGASIDDFLSWFPGVTKEQVEAVLEYTIQSLKADLQAA
ncbi:MAG: hypothetical protein QOH63_2568 [Acidobacteriota bacterium]|nr:hypothetical protein [Acidobacteriota bacterium]